MIGTRDVPSSGGAKYATLEHWELAEEAASLRRALAPLYVAALALPYKDESDVSDEERARRTRNHQAIFDAHEALGRYGLRV